MSLTFRVHQNDQGKRPTVINGVNAWVVAGDPHSPDYRLITASSPESFAICKEHFDRERIWYEVVS